MPAIRLTPIPPARPPLELAYAALLTGIAHLTAPALPLSPEPEEFEAISNHLLKLSDIVDSYIAAVGAHVADNASMGVDQRLFRAQLRGALEGNATYEIASIAADMRDERAYPKENF